MSGVLSALGEFREASFRGIPFAVLGDEGEQGRKVALHEYPFRDTPWPEDLGRRLRLYRIRGFVVGDTAYVQRDLIALAAETPGPGLLIHPTIGIVNASVLRFVWREPEGRSGIIELELEFVEYRNLLTTSVQLALQATVAVGMLAAAAAASDDYGNDTASAFALGAPVRVAAIAVASGWASAAGAAASDAAIIGSAALGLPGNLGRYASGHGGAAPDGATIASQIALYTAAATTLAVAVAAVTAAASSDALPGAIAALPEALRAAIPDPVDQVRVLTPLAGLQVSALASTAPIGAAIASVQVATATLCRRSALLSIALAAAAYEPTTYDEAEQLRGALAALFQAEILIAADAGDDETYQALRALRAQVLADLAERATMLPTLTAVTRAAPLPALVLAQQLYADATRSDELIARADPIHPAFMPLTFLAAAS